MNQNKLNKLNKFISVAYANNTMHNRPTTNVNKGNRKLV